MGNKYDELMDEMYELNAMLEVCRGYTQADQPNLDALDIVLYGLRQKYEQLHRNLLEYEKENR